MSIKCITEIIKGWVSSNPSSEIETFIASRNPKNPADVENLIKQWNYSRERHWLQ
jgi:hypothetical protein